MSSSRSEHEVDAVSAQMVDGGFDYVISGLNVRSQIELPSAIRAEAHHAEPDVTITLGKVPDGLSSPQKSGNGWAVHGDSFWLKMKGIMSVLVQGGRSILVEPDPKFEPKDLVLYLLGTAFAIVLQQRGRVVLHASAVAVDGRAMLFCGQSGAGKSTMAAMLGQRGYPLLNDDVCSLSLSASGEYVVHPDGRLLKLWSRSIEHLAWAGDEKSRIRHDMEKFYMEPDHVDLTPRPVGGVYVLHPMEEEGDATLQALPTAEAMAELLKNAYRPTLVHAMGMSSAYFQVSVTIKQRADVFRLSRPMDFTRANEALDLLQASWSKSSA